MKSYYVYIVANWNNKVIYIGMTNDLQRRVYEHKERLLEGFSKKYRTTKLVFFQEFQDVNEAIEREKQVKKWRREKKNALIQEFNPAWNDLLAE